MKKYISAVLIPCLLLQLLSCYSISPLEEGEDINEYLQDSRQDIMFILKNDSEIETKSEYCELIAGRKYLIYGYGTAIDKTTKEGNPFRGLLYEEVIDSVRSININSEEFLVCWLKDSTRISFNENSFLASSINPDSSYWLVKNTEPPHLFNVNDVKEIQVAKIDVIPTIILGVITVGLIVAMIIIFSGLGSFKGSGSGCSNSDWKLPNYY